MGILGVKYAEIAAKTVDDFEGDDEEKELQLTFYDQQRDTLLAELAECKQRVIDERLCDEQALMEEEEEHLKQLLHEEDAKLQKVFERQDRETKRLLNEQITLMHQHEKQRQLEAEEADKLKRKQEELARIHAQKLAKRAEIEERRKRAERLQREKEKQRFLAALKKREENDERLIAEQQRKEQYRQNILHKRVKEFHEKRVERIQQEEALDEQQLSKMENIMNRYHAEDTRYVSHLHERINCVQSDYEKRKQRHTENYQRHRRELKQKHEQLLAKQRADEERLKQFQLKKEKELKQKKLQRQQKLHEALCAAKGGEEARLKKIEQDGARAAENRRKFFAKKRREEHLKRLVAKLKKQAAVASTERNFRAKDFKNQQLLAKNKREDMRRIKDMELKEALRQQRIMNDTSVKMRQEQLKEEIIDANKNGDADKLKELIQELESKATVSSSKRSTTCQSPLKSAKKNVPKVHVVMSPKNVDSSLAKHSSLQENKLKADIYRTLH